eukprot:RCo046174
MHSSAHATVCVSLLLHRESSAPSSAFGKKRFGNPCVPSFERASLSREGSGIFRLLFLPLPPSAHILSFSEREPRFYMSRWPQVVLSMVFRCFFTRWVLTLIPTLRGAQTFLVNTSALQGGVFGVLMGPEEMRT